MAFMQPGGGQLTPEMIEAMRKKLLDPAERVALAQKLALMMDAPQIEAFLQGTGASPPPSDNVFGRLTNG